MAGDYFSDRSDAYARYRPRYPDALFAWLASLPAGRERAWDCATGSGQAALALAPYFGEVVATDLSGAQIARAPAHPRVRYAEAPAEASGLPDASVDLVTVAQALHWLDFDAFFAEVRRVAKPGAILAAWAYGLQEIDPPVDAVLRRFYFEVVGSFWPPERRYVENGYATIPFPFPEIAAPLFAMEADWDLPHLVGYLRTWSAAREYERWHRRDPVAEVEPDLAGAWGDASKPKRVRWPLHLRVGRVSDR